MLSTYRANIGARITFCPTNREMLFNALQEAILSQIFEEGKVYIIEAFSIAPNKDKYRIRHSDERVIELEGYSVVKQLDCVSSGFVRFPFQLVPLDEIRANARPT